MDVRTYYRKVREIEEQISGNVTVIKSLETPDGGKAGVLVEVSRRNAAILVTDGRAVLASPEEAQQFRDAVKAAKLEADKAEAARQLHVRVVEQAFNRTKG